VSNVAVLESGTDTEAPEETPDERDARLQTEAWGDLNPCRVCGAHQVEAPEREVRTALHCFKCGYRPGLAVPVGALAGPTITQAGIDAALRDLKTGIMADLFAAFRSGQIPRVEITPATVEQTATAARAAAQAAAAGEGTV
jgi:hypothetical protein